MVVLGGPFRGAVWLEAGLVGAVFWGWFWCESFQRVFCARGFWGEFRGAFHSRSSREAALEEEPLRVEVASMA